jgi:hypothetical protein
MGGFRIIRRVPPRRFKVSLHFDSTEYKQKASRNAGSITFYMATFSISMTHHDTIEYT